jgi:hypothetical protein
MACHGELVEPRRAQWPENALMKNKHLINQYFVYIYFAVIILIIRA